MHARLYHIALVIACLFLLCTPERKQPNPTAPDTTPQPHQNSGSPRMLSMLGDTATLTDADIEALFPQPQPLPERDDSYHRISRALAAGEITEEQSLVLTIQAALAPDSLPVAYRGTTPNPGASPIDRAIARAVQDSTLSAQTRTALEPFLQTTIDSASGFHAMAKKAGTGWWVTAMSIGGKDSAVLIGYRTIPSLTAAQTTAMRSKIEAVKKALLKAWPKYKFLLGVIPDAPIHITISHPVETKLNVYGVAIPKKGGIYRIKLNYYQDYKDHHLRNVTESDNRHLRSAVAHELFHIFQYTLSTRFAGHSDEINWLVESAATWAEEYIYPSHNAEHEHFGPFFHHLHKNLICGDTLRWYGNHMWWRFLQQHLRTTMPIAEIHKAAAQSESSIADLIENSVRDFPSLYAEFARYNWNTKPNVVYTDIPSMPPYPLAFPTKRKKVIDTRCETPMHDTLMKGGMIYHALAFKAPPDSIARVILAFNPAYESQSIQRQALVLVGDTWYIEDYTGMDTVTYCRRSATECVKALVICHANADLGATGAVDYTIDTRKQCRTALSGVLTVEESYTSSDGTVSYHSSLTSVETIEYDKSVDAYRIVNRSTSFSSTNSTDMGEVMPGMPMAQNTVENGSVVESYASGEGPIRFALPPSSYIAIDAETNSTDWLTRTSTLEGGGTTTEKTTPAGTWKPDYPLESSEILSDRIKGTKQVVEMGLYPVTVDITFEYVFSAR
jgi:hypothetical protein